jgi:hypothetical protein
MSNKHAGKSMVDRANEIIAAWESEDKPGDVRVEKMTLTPELAAQWLREYQYGGQRAVNRRRVETIKETIKPGLFEQSEVRICYVGDRGYLTNGQHRCVAVLESNIPVPVVVVRRLLSTDEEVARDFSAHDVRTSVRSYGDTYNAHHLTDETGLSSTNVQRVATGAAFIEAGFRVGEVTRSAEVRVGLVREWAPAGQTYFDAMAGGSTRLVRTMGTAPVGAVGLLTCRYCPDEAVPFWRSVALNDNLSPGTPAHTLLRFLLDHKIYSGNYPYAVRAVAHCWNTHQAGRSLSFLKIVNPNGPVVVNGTPYK